MMERQAQSNLRFAQPRIYPAYRTLDIQYEEEYELSWYFMHPKPRACCTQELVCEIKDWFTTVINAKTEKPRYVALASKAPGIFNLGGDLERTCLLIREQDRNGLLGYAMACVDTLLLNYSGLGQNITTISLVQGDALGGGLEYALSSHVLIAERGSKMGFPEVLFNLFPGVGAFSLLSRKIGAKAAEEMILGGRLHTAEEMHSIGVVDILAEEGQGEAAVYNYISEEERSCNAIRAFRQAKKCTNPVTFEELESVAKIWADAALQLRDKDLRMIERLIKRQSARVE